MLNEFCNMHDLKIIQQFTVESERKGDGKRKIKKENKQICTEYRWIE